MNHVILIDLDVLLDTRLATLSLISKEAAEYVLSPTQISKYQTREIDDWYELTGGRVDNETFKAAYAKRDVTTLQASMVTNCVELLTAMTNQLESMIIYTPLAKSVTVEVNYWPYVLSPEELDAFELCISSYASLISTVKMVSLPPGRITPLTLKDHYSGYITYDFETWLGYQHAALLQVKIPSVSLMACGLRKATPTEAEYEEMQIRDLFKATETIMAEYIELSLASARFYSIINLTS